MLCTVHSLLISLVCCWFISILEHVAAIVGGPSYVSSQTHAQPCKRTKDDRGLWWTYEKNIDGCQWYSGDNVRCGVCGRPEYYYIDWTRYSWTWIADQQPRCRHLYNEIGRGNRSEGRYTIEIEGIYGITPDIGGSIYGPCFLRAGCSVRGVWTVGSAVGCQQIACVEGYGVPRCHCDSHSTYGQRCQFPKPGNDSVRYSQGVQVFVKPLVRSSEDLPMVISNDFEGTGFFIEINTEIGQDFRWINTPISRDETKFYGICQTLTNLNKSCDFIKLASALYSTKMKFPVIKDLSKLHFYRESNMSYPIGYQETIHVEAYNTPHIGKYIQDKTALVKIFETDITVFVEYPVQIHCHKIIDIEHYCKTAQTNVKPYIPTKTIIFIGKVHDSNDKLLDVQYENAGDKLKCFDKQYDSTHWVLWKAQKDGSKQVIKERKTQGEFIFNIAPYQLEEGLYKVEFTYSMLTNYDDRSNFAQCTLNVFALDLIAIIDGGYKRYVDVENVITIDGSQSEDPNLRPNISKIGLDFAWSCSGVDDQGEPCLVEKIARIRKGPIKNVIKLFSYTFTAWKQYKISMKVSKIGREPANTYQLLQIGTGSVSSISISCMSCYMHSVKGAVANPEETIYLRLRIMYKPNYEQTVNVSRFVWVYSEDETAEGEEAASIRIQGRNPNIFKIKENVLKTDRTYYFTAKASSREAGIKLYTSSMNDTVCDWYPKSGIRGITLFNVTCKYEGSSEEDYTFEFYDNTESDKNYLSGRMLGSGKEVKPFRLTNGRITVYTFTKNKMYKKFQFKIELSPFNQTAQYIRDKYHSISKLLDQQNFEEAMVESTLLSDLVTSKLNRKIQVKKFVTYLNQVRVFDTANMKMCLSSLYYIFKTFETNHEHLGVDPVLNKQVADILLRVVFQLFLSLQQKDEEFTLLNSVVDRVCEPIIKLSGTVIFQTHPLKPVELINPRDVDLMQSAAANIIQVFERLGTYLLNRQIEDDDAKEISSKHVTMWVRSNTNDAWLRSTETDGIPPIKLPKSSKSLPLNTEESIGIQITKIKKNPFWWSKVNIVTEVLLIEACNKINNSFCNKIVQTSRDPFQIEFDIAEKVNSLKLLEGTTGGVHPGSSLEDIDLAITVYRFDPPSNSLSLIELICDQPSDKEFKVLVMKNLRPDYRMINEYGKTLSCQSKQTPLTQKKTGKDEFFYMGIIPKQQNISANKPNFKFLIFYTVCYHWEVWQWQSYSCWPGDKTDKYLLQCDCTHLSTFAGSVGIPLTVSNASGMFPMLAIEEGNWALSVVLVLIIILIYVLLLVWGRWKDIKDLKSKNVIVLNDNYPGDKYPFLIGVFTGSRLNASCNANVGVKLYGEDNQSRAHILKGNEKQEFKGNSDDWFLLYCPQPLGTLNSLQLWHDNTGTSPDWFVETIVVIDLKDKLEYFFELNVWIALEVNDYPEVVANPLSVHDYFSVKRVFLDNSVTGLRDTHYWTSILWKHPRNPVTRVQRVNVVMTFIMVAMLTSFVLFYVVYNISDVPEDIPYFEITGKDWLIFVISSVLSSFTACFIMTFFRKSYSHDKKDQSKKSSVFLRPSETETRGSHVPSLTAFELEHDYINVPKGLLDDTFIRYGMRSKPSYERTTFQNFGVALHSILRGSSLEHVKLPQYESTLRVNKTFSIVAWLLITLIILTCIITVFILGLQFPPVIAQKCITIFVLIVLFDMLVVSTLKVLLLSAILSFMFLRLLPSPNYNVKPKDGMAKHLKGNVDHLCYLADIRSQPMYCPLSENMKVIYRDQRINIMRWKLLLDFVVLIILVMFLILLSTYQIKNQYFVNNHAELVVTEGHKVTKYTRPNYYHVYNRTSFEEFLLNTLFPQLYKFLWYNMEDPLEPDFYNARSKSWTYDCVMKLLGNGRFRQVRVQLDTCSEVSFVGDMRKFCAPSWSPSIEDQDVYSSGWKQASYKDVIEESTAWKYTDPQVSGSSKIIGNTLTAYHEGGYIIDLDYHREGTLEAITQLLSKKWLDHMTRAVFIEMTLLNVNTGLLSQVILASEQMATGQYLQKAHIDSFSIEKGVSIWNICFIIFLLFFLVRMTVLMNRNGIMVYLSAGINVYEVFLLILGLTTLTLYFVYGHLFSNHVQEFQRSGIDTFFSFSNILSYLYLSKAFMAFLFTFLVVRLLMSWRFGRVYYTFFYTFLLSLSWIVWLVLYFNLLFVVIWRMIGFVLDIYILPYYTTFLIYYNEYPYLTGITMQRKVLAYFMCLLSYLIILAFIASFLYYYRVAKVYRLINTNSFNFGTFLSGKIKGQLRRRRNLENNTKVPEADEYH